MVSELRGHVEECVRDQNGNHVIQKCIEEVPKKIYIQLVVYTFQNKVFQYSAHPYGCRVIQRLLEHCSPEQQLPLLKEILTSTIPLSKDQYGNYVVQHVLEHGADKARIRIIEEVAQNLLAMSKHKFSSNVVEKAFAFARDHERDVLLNVMIGENFSKIPEHPPNPNATEDSKQDAENDKNSNVVNATGDASINAEESKIDATQDMQNDGNKDMGLTKQQGGELGPDGLAATMDTTPLTQMVKDQFGNYVVQKVLEVSNPAQRKRLVSKIVELVPNLRKLMFGKHIITKIEKLTGEHLALADDNVGVGQIGGPLSGAGTGALNGVTPGLIGNTSNALHQLTPAGAQQRSNQMMDLTAIGMQRLSIVPNTGKSSQDVRSGGGVQGGFQPHGGHNSNMGGNMGGNMGAINGSQNRPRTGMYQRGGAGGRSDEYQSRRDRGSRDHRGRQFQRYEVKRKNQY